MLLLCAGVELEARFADLCAAAAGDERVRRPRSASRSRCLPDAHWSAIAPAAPAALAPPRRARARRERDHEPAPDRRARPAPPRRASTTSTTALQRPASSRRRAASSCRPRTQAVAAELRRRLRGAAAGAAPVTALGGARRRLAPGRRRVGLRPARARRSTRCARATCRVAAAERDALLPPAGSARRCSTGCALLLEVDDDADADVAQAGGGARGRARRRRSSSAPASRSRELRRAAVRLDVATPRRGGAARALGEPARRARRRAQRRRRRARRPLRPRRRRRSTAACAAGGRRRPRARRGALGGLPRVRRARGSTTSRSGSSRWRGLGRPRAPGGRSCAVLREIDAARARPRAASTRSGASRAKSARGLGISALFAGPSGTGKTMAAEVLARELDLDLYRIDLQPGREQVHRRDGEEPAARLRRGRGRRRDPALRRGGRAVRQAQRGQGQPRPLRQHRGQLPAAAHGGLPRPRDPDDEPSKTRSTTRSCAGFASSSTSRSPTRRSARRSGGAIFPAETPIAGLDVETLGATSRWPAATSATSP